MYKFGARVEVGSYRGKSAIAMAHGLPESAANGEPMLYCVEPHKPFKGFYGGQFGPEDRGEFSRVMLETKAFRRVALVPISRAKSWRRGGGSRWACCRWRSYLRGSETGFRLLGSASPRGGACCVRRFDRPGVRSLAIGQGTARDLRVRTGQPLRKDHHVAQKLLGRRPGVRRKRAAQYPDPMPSNGAARRIASL